MTDQVTALARADGSSVLGLGNVTRALAVAEALRERKVRVIFVAREFDPRVRAHVEQAGFAFSGMNPALSLEEDVEFVARLAETEGASLGIVDLSNVQATEQLSEYSHYLARLAERLPLTIIDDLTRATFPRALVVNPNTEIAAETYDRTLGPEFLLGPRFAVLRPDYVDAAGGRPAPSGPPRSVLVALGGGALGGRLLAMAVEGVVNAFGPEVELTLVARAPDTAELAASGVLARIRGRVECLEGLPSLVELLRSSDVAIVSGGVTKYEAAATATPSVMVATVEHQEPWAESFARTGAALYAGSAPALTPAILAGAAQPLLDPLTRGSMGRLGATLVDGRGADRIAEESLGRLR